MQRLLNDRRRAASIQIRADKRAVSALPVSDNTVVKTFHLFNRATLLVRSESMDAQQSVTYDHRVRRSSRSNVLHSNLHQVNSQSRICHAICRTAVVLVNSDNDFIGNDDSAGDSKVWDTTQ